MMNIVQVDIDVYYNYDIVDSLFILRIPSYGILVHKHLS